MSLTIEGIDETIKFVEDVTMDAVVGTALETGSRLMSKTPRDTGFAANSWVVTDSPDDIGTLGGNSIDQNLQRLRRLNIGEIVYINNGCEYIGPLNNGHSQKAPYGMTYKVMPEVPGIFRKQIDDAQRKGR